MSITLKKPNLEALIRVLTAKSKDKIPPKLLAERITLAASVFTPPPNTSSDNAAFSLFCEQHFATSKKERLQLVHKLDRVLQYIGGTGVFLYKILSEGVEIADEALTAVDVLLSNYPSMSHTSEDLRKSNIAALVQLNFGTSATTPCKTREDWAERRLSSTGREYLPAELSTEFMLASNNASVFVKNFNLYLDNITFSDSRVRFPKDSVCIHHWGLRETMTHQNGTQDGLIRQYAIRDLMRRVITGDLPREIINNPKARWDMATDTVTLDNKKIRHTQSGAERWEYFRKCFEVHKKIDPYRRHKNLIDDNFLCSHELPEARVEKILTDILASPLAARVAKLIEKTLGRAIEPHDIFFKEFDRGEVDHGMNKKLEKKYPNPQALHADIPHILQKLGFEKKHAAFIGSKIRIDNSRSAGHASGPVIPEDLQLLRVRFGKRGINRANFETFMHELGHATEQVISFHQIDFKLLSGVPATSFTEAFAFTFQEKTEEILGNKKTNKNAHALQTIRSYWETFHIAGPSLVEMRLYRWLYKNKDASAQEIHQEVIRIGEEVWAKFYAPILGKDSYCFCSTYSHMLDGSFYLAHYALGHVIGFQVQEFLRNRNLGTEMTRLCKIGNIYPDSWMQTAVGAPVSVDPLIIKTDKSLKSIGF